MSERQVRTCLDTLKRLGNMSVKPTTKYSIITIINWSTYQSREVDNDQQDGHQPADEVPQTRRGRSKNRLRKNQGFSSSPKTDFKGDMANEYRVDEYC